MTKFGELFANRRWVASMLDKMQREEQRRQEHVRRMVWGDRVVYVDLRELTTTRSRGI